MKRGQSVYCVKIRTEENRVNRLSPISPAHDMEDGSFILDPELACHSYFLSGKGFSLQEKSLNTRD